MIKNTTQKYNTPRRFFKLMDNAIEVKPDAKQIQLPQIKKKTKKGGRKKIKKTKKHRKHSSK
jgi:hypothetical protein